MISAVVDTHALVWYVFDDPRLSRAAAAAFDGAEAAGEFVGVSSISLVELVYLAEKRRIDPLARDRIFELLSSGVLFPEVRVDHAVADALWRIDRAAVPDMPDRIIAATASMLAVPLISRDGKIQASSVTTLW